MSLGHFSSPPPAFGRPMRAQFLLEEGTTHLNNGSCGAVPIVVQEARERLLREEEANPDRFSRNTRYPLFAAARGKLAAFINCDPEDVAFVQNATTGVNSVVRSLNLKSTDIVLSFDLAYDACRHTINYTVARAGAQSVFIPIEFPTSSESIVAKLEAALAEHAGRVKLLMADHICSKTAVLMPLAEILAAARRAGVPTLVDGAHAPGQLALDMAAIDPDYYTGNLHKWAFVPRGCAFLYVRKSLQNTVQPVITSHGYNKGFERDFEEQATRDESTFLSSPVAIDFMNWIGVGAMRDYQRSMLEQGIGILSSSWGTTTITAPRSNTLALVQLPAIDWLKPSDSSAGNLFSLLNRRFKITVPIMCVVNAGAPQLYARISAQIYNEARDYEHLAQAVTQLRGEDETTSGYKQMPPREW